VPRSSSSSSKKLFEFSREDLEERFSDLYYSCSVYVERKTSPDLKVSFDPAVLRSAVVSAYDDIARYKNYHQGRPYTEKSDAIKRAAYITKWLLRNRPIYTARPLGPDLVLDEDDGNLLYNEFFAIGWSFINMAADLPASPSPQGLFFPDFDRLRNLVYVLKYRDISSDALMEIYKMYLYAYEKEKIFLD
jgi:hypothetical protein